MQRALDLSTHAAGRTAPNPAVGAVVVREDRVVGEGWTEPAGGQHAETVALAQAGDAARGATLYVTLEPCSHQGRTPPCAPAVVAAGVQRAVVAMQDPDARVSGRGLEILREGGVEIQVGVLSAAAARANEAYLYRVRTGRALGVLKAAVTLDGRLHADGGDSRWITGEAARARTHELRDRHDAILVGRGTVQADDPSLNVRLPGTGHRDPWVVVLDTQLVTAREPHRLWDRAEQGGRVLVASGPNAPQDGRDHLASRGVDVLSVPVAETGGLDLRELFRALAERGINSVLVEGGGQVHTSCLAAGVIGRVHLFVAPRFLGGRQAGHVIRDLGRTRIADAISLVDVEHESLGDDVLISGRVEAE